MEIRVEAAAAAPHAVTVAGLPADEVARLAALDAAALAARLQVFTGAGVPAADQPAVAGAVTRTADGLQFRPLFPFVAGLPYTAVYRGTPPLRRHFAAEASGGPPPRVVALFPSADALPENTLRLYVRFSQPMEERDVARHVRLLDETGGPVPLAFVEIPHGLWDGSRTRLTLLFHPGRLKRGIAPGERLGTPLRAGHRYRLEVDAALRDAQGRALGAPFVRAFDAVPADRDSPGAGGVAVAAPASSSAPLVVTLPEALDEALLQRLVWVEDAAGNGVAGAIAVGSGETRWTFTPARPWTPGAYALRVHPALEDRAGNRFDRVFDRAIAAGAAPEPDPAGEPLRLPFEVRP